MTRKVSVRDFQAGLRAGRRPLPNSGRVVCSQCGSTTTEGGSVLVLVDQGELFPEQVRLCGECRRDAGVKREHEWCALDRRSRARPVLEYAEQSQGEWMPWMAGQDEEDQGPAYTSLGRYL